MWKRYSRGFQIVWVGGSGCDGKRVREGMLARPSRPSPPFRSVLPYFPPSFRPSSFVICGQAPTGWSTFRGPGDSGHSENIFTPEFESSGNIVTPVQDFLGLVLPRYDGNSGRPIWPHLRTGIDGYVGSTPITGMNQRPSFLILCAAQADDTIKAELEKFQTFVDQEWWAFFYSVQEYLIRSFALSCSHVCMCVLSVYSICVCLYTVYIYIYIYI